MKTTFIVCALCVLRVSAFSGEIIRDSAGNVISVTTMTATGKTTRNAAGAVLEQKTRTLYPDASKTIFVRDQANTLIRTESKKADSRKR